MTTVHAARLAALEHKFMGGGVGTGVRTKFLIGERKGHDGCLRGDAIGGFELVDMCW